MTAKAKASFECFRNDLIRFASANSRMYRSREAPVHNSMLEERFSAVSADLTVEASLAATKKERAHTSGRRKVSMGTRMLFGMPFLFRRPGFEFRFHSSVSSIF